MLLTFLTRMTPFLTVSSREVSDMNTSLFNPIGQDLINTLAFNNSI